MIAPLIPFAIRGAIWYQGESNAGRAYQYRTLFPAMIRNWRADWGQGDFPFGFVQIAPFRYGDADPACCAELCEAQPMTLRSLPNTGMAVTVDIGDVKDIHPKNKQEVGRRLALWALAKVYGKDVVYSGPLYKSMAVEGDKIRIEFEHVGGGLVSRDGKPLTEFTIAGADQKFVPAAAEIDGNSVVVHSADVAAPVAVRFAWRDDAAPNLSNKEGLPAASLPHRYVEGVDRGKVTQLPRKNSIRGLPKSANPSISDTSGRGGSSNRHGRRIVNVLPLPSSLSTVTSPPSSLQSSLTIESPKPVPECSRVMASPPGMAVRPWRNFSKIACWSSSAMPTPVSLTESTMKSRASRSTETVILPPSGVNLIAFESKLLRICCTRAWSWRIGGRSAGSRHLEVDIFLFRERPGHVALCRDDRLDAELRQSRCHLAALDLRQVENVVDHVQERPARLLDVLHVAFLLLVQGVDRVEHVAEAQNAVQRRSQLVAHRREEIALEHVHFIEPHVDLRQFIDFAVEAGVDLPQFFLDGGQMPQHAVERHGQLLELVAGVDVGPQRDIAAADRVAHVAEVAQRFHDHVTHDDVGGEHRQENGDDGRGHEDRLVPVQRLARWRHWGSTLCKSPAIPPEIERPTFPRGSWLTLKAPLLAGV